MQELGPTAFIPGNSAMPVSTVELSVRCENLGNLDILSKSDPACILSVKQFNGTSQYIEIGRTEIIQDCLNPIWVKKFIVDYKFEERQELRFEVFDWDDTTSSDLSKQDFLGRMECSLAEIVATQGSVFSRNLESRHGGKIIVSAEELSLNNDLITMQFLGRKLDKKDFFGKSDPFFVISKANEGNHWTAVHKSEVIKNTLNPTWNTFSISARNLCNGDYFRSLKFEIFDWNLSGNHEIIGEFETNVDQLKKGPCSENSYGCINKKKLKKSSYKDSGTIVLVNMTVEEQPTFLEFIQGGLQMNFTVAVDFTASNGSPHDPGSRHYMNPNGGQNEYTIAIKAVGDIIQDYDSDKLFPALGFGARIPPSGVVSHEFFLNMQSDPHCKGVDGVLAAYYQALHSVQLYGPTNFSPVINHVARFAKTYQDGKNYFVLLIITDGIITDLEATKRAIIFASSLPMSIIIVGVGKEDFSAMEALDSDDQLLRTGTLLAKRDIVQFVEMSKFLTHGQWTKDFLAKEVLAEVPGQVTGYMKMRGITPSKK